MRVNSRLLSNLVVIMQICSVVSNHIPRQSGLNALYTTKSIAIYPHNPKGNMQRRQTKSASKVGLGFDGLGEFTEQHARCAHSLIDQIMRDSSR